MLSFSRFLVFCSLLTVASAHARQLELGSVDFSTSGSGQAQTHFLRGVAALHSFWYPVALEEFRAATRADPDFMMGYWGEAMAHDHPIWGDPQETEAARKVIAKIKITPELTKKEKTYLNAVKILYSDGKKEARDQAYADAMANIYREYPDDAASKKWVEKNNLSIAERDHHSPHWLLYAYLQQGRYDDAEALLEVMQKSLAEGPKDDPMFQGYGTFIYASMASAFVIETERWELAEKLFAPLQQNAQLRSVAEKPGPFQPLAKYVQALTIFTPGFSAAKQGSPDAQKSIAQLQAMAKEAGKEVVSNLGMSLSHLLEIQRLEIAAAASAANGDLEQAVEALKQAIALEESSQPPPGPPPLIKPSHELAGEISLQAKRPKDAAQEFSTSLLRHDDRAHSLIGAARAAATSGNREDAAEAYAKYLEQWQGKYGPRLNEAQDYVKSAGAFAGK